MSNGFRIEPMGKDHHEVCHKVLLGQQFSNSLSSSQLLGLFKYWKTKPDLEIKDENPVIAKGMIPIKQV